MSADGRDGAEPPVGGPPAGDGASDDERRDRDRGTVVAVFATFLYLALVVCAFGFVSLLADVDVVSRSGTGRLVGPAMVATAVVVVLAALVREARRPGGSATPGTEGREATWPLFVGAVTLLGFVGVGIVLVAVESRRWFDGVLFASSTLTSAFPWIAGALAVVVAVAFRVTVAGSSGQRPRWPWEGEDDLER